MNMPALPPEHHHDSDHVYFTADQLLAYAEAAVLAEREACAKLCDKLSTRTLAAQEGDVDQLGNVMLRQVAVLGHQEAANVIRARKDTV